MDGNGVADVGRYQRFRQNTPRGDLKYVSTYEWDGAELQYLNQNQVDAVYTEVLDLTVAQTFQQPKVLSIPGRCAVIYGIDLSSSAAYDPTANTGIERIAGDVFVFCRLNGTRLDEGIPLKHNRGFRGPFVQLQLSWPAQANRKARLIVYKADWVPWQNGEAAT